MCACIYIKIYIKQIFILVILFFIIGILNNKLNFSINLWTLILKALIIFICIITIIFFVLIIDKRQRKELKECWL